MEAAERAKATHAALMAARVRARKATASVREAERAVAKFDRASKPKPPPKKRAAAQVISAEEAVQADDAVIAALAQPRKKRAPKPKLGVPDLAAMVREMSEAQRAKLIRGLVAAPQSSDDDDFEEGELGTSSASATSDGGASSSDPEEPLQLDAEAARRTVGAKAPRLSTDSLPVV